MEITVSPLFKASGRKLRALRQKDPEKNLFERWKLLLEERPDFELRYGFVPMILETGWAVVAIPEDGLAFTVGLHYRFGQKELLISAPKLKPEAQKRLLNQLARRVIEGERFEPGARVTFDGGEQVSLAKYEDATFTKYPCGYLARFEQYFEDRLHVAGGTLPVLWGVLQPARAKKAKQKPAKARAGVMSERRGITAA